MRSGWELSVRGLSGKQRVFLEKILKAAFSLKLGGESFDDDRFELIKEQYKRSVSNQEAGSMKARSRRLLGQVLCPHSYSREDRLDALNKDFGLKEVRQFANELRMGFSVEIFAFGDLSREEASSLADVVLQTRTEWD